jgi:hypothetical protein
MKFQSHLAFSLILLKTINFNFIMDIVIHIYLEDFHDTNILLSIKINRLVNFKSLLSNIQFASL